MSIERLSGFEAGKAFEFEKKNYVIKSVSYKDLKYMIFTDKRTFVFFESELNDFLDKIISIDLPVSKQQFIPNIEVRTNPVDAEIINANSRSLRIADKLEEMFNTISVGDLTEADLKKAYTMVQLSNAIVANEVVRFRYLSLKNQ